MTTQPQKLFTASEIIVSSWKLVRQSWSQYLALIGITILVYIGYAIVYGLLMAMQVPEGINSVLSFLLGVYVTILITRGSLMIAREQKLDFGSLFKIKAKTYLQLILTTLLLYFVVGIGLVLLIVPGVILALMFSYSIFSVIDVDTDVITAFKDSANLTKGHRWEIFAYHLILGVITLAGLLVPAGVILLAVSQVDGFSMSMLGPLLLVALLLALLAVIFGVTISMVNMAGQAFMYLKLREHTPAPKA